MRIQCPSCRARFKLADNKIPTDGVKVRCSRCKHVFRVLPDPPTVVQRAKISDVHDATLGPSGIYADRPDPSSLFASDDPFAAMGAGGDDAMPFASGEPSGPASRHKKHNRTMQGAAARNLLNRPQDASQQARSQAVQALKKPTPRADPFRMSDPFQDGSPGRGDQASLSDVLGGGGGSGSRGLKQTQALGSHRSETLIRPGDNDDPFAPDALGGGDEFAAFFAEGGGGGGPSKTPARGAGVRRPRRQQRDSGGGRAPNAGGRPSNGRASNTSSGRVPDRRPPAKGRTPGHGATAQGRTSRGPVASGRVSGGAPPKASQPSADDPFSTNFPEGERSDLGDIFTEDKPKAVQPQAADPFAALEQEEQSPDPFGFGGVDHGSFSLDESPLDRSPAAQAHDPFDFGTRDLPALDDASAQQLPTPQLSSESDGDGMLGAAFFGADVPSADSHVPPPDDFSLIPGLGGGDPSEEGFPDALLPEEGEGAAPNTRKKSKTKKNLKDRARKLKEGELKVGDAADFNPLKDPKLSSRSSSPQDEGEDDSFLGDRDRAKQFAPTENDGGFLGGNDDDSAFFEPERSPFDDAEATASQRSSQRLRSVSLTPSTIAPAQEEVGSLPRPRAAESSQKSKGGGQFVAPSPQVAEIVVERRTSALQALANFALIVLLLANGFLAFVAWKNGGVLHLAELGSQVRVAFGAADAAAVSPKKKAKASAQILGVEQLEPVQASNRNARALFVIEGAVVNRSKDAYQEVQVKGTVVDASGKTIASSTAPVGRALTEDELLDVTDHNSLKDFYDTVQLESADLTIGPSEAARFSVVFPDVDPAQAQANKYSFDVVIASSTKGTPNDKTKGD